VYKSANSDTRNLSYSSVCHVNLMLAYAYSIDSIAVVDRMRLLGNGESAQISPLWCVFNSSRFIGLSSFVENRYWLQLELQLRKACSYCTRVQTRFAFLVSRYVLTIVKMPSLFILVFLAMHAATGR
jgi:hypothetical protein